MSHELENGATGTADDASFVEFGTTRSAWHRLGRLLPVIPRTFDEFMNVAPFLDYPVEKLPTRVTMKTPDGGDTYDIESKVAFVTVRTDTNRELGSVGPQYQPVQNRDAFRHTVGPLLDAGVLKAETAGVLRDGADAWMLGAFDLDRFGPVVQEVFAGEVVPYALVSVNHSGRRNNTIALTPVRVVCANTLGMVESDVDGGHSKAASIRHTGDVEARMTEAAQSLFGGIVARYEVIATQYRALKARGLDEALFRSLVLLPVIGAHPTQRTEFNPEAKLAENMVERYEKRRDEITRLWTEGAGHTGDGSAWEAYNGVVQAIDHNEDVFPARSGVYRLGSLMEGELRAKKDKALRSLVTYAQGSADARIAARDAAAETAGLVLAK